MLSVLHLSPCRAIANHALTLARSLCLLTLGTCAQASGELGALVGAHLTSAAGADGIRPFQ